MIADPRMNSSKTECLNGDGGIKGNNTNDWRKMMNLVQLTSDDVALF